MRYTHILSVIVTLVISINVKGQQFAEHSVLSSGKWYKLTIADEGIYKLTAKELPTASAPRIDAINIYGLHGGMLSETNGANDENDLKPYPVYANDANGNGLFDGSDYILFYSEGADTWKYQASTSRYMHIRNAYSSRQYCYLRIDDKTPYRISTSSEVGAGGRITTYTAVAYHENDLVNPYESGRKYVGEQFNASVNTRTITINTDGAPKNTPMYVRYGFANMEDASARMSIAINGNEVQQYFTGSTGHYIYSSKFVSNGSKNVDVQIKYLPSNSHANGYLDFVEITHSAALSYSGGQRIYRLDPAENGSIYELAYNGAPTIWDISDIYGVSIIAGNNEGDKKTFSLHGNGNHKIAVFDNTFNTIEKIESQECQDLHKLQGVDYVVVAHPNYRAEAEELAGMHAIYDNMTTATVTPQEIYNEFSSGRQDPMAIRLFLRMLHQRDGVKYLTLFGKGSYDNRDIEGNSETTIVTYESEDSFTESGSYGCDDMMGYLDMNENGTNSGDDLDISIGRIPARNIEEARHLVSKIKDYLNKKDLQDADSRGDWRSYVALLADDADPSSKSDTLFTHSAEDLANNIKALSNIYTIDRIYADAYVEQTGAIGSYYPDANNALKKRMDYGCLLLNYIGHGSMQYIGTERYISSTDISGYANIGRPAFVVTSTCTFGKYDKPKGVSGAELFLHADGGAIGVISASRPINHIERFNTDLCVKLLTQGTRAGDALTAAKNRTKVSHSITLLGDPALPLSIPQQEIVVTSVNEKKVQEDMADSATALSTVTITGEIRHNGVPQPFDGKLYATVFDRETTSQTLSNDNEDASVKFRQQKNILYKGSTTVSDGKFTYSFVVPRDVAYTYGQGKLSHYASNENGEDAIGSYTNVYFGGFDTTAAIAEFHPHIQLYINDSTFRNGGTTDENPILIAYLSDSVGINSIGSGLGHDITAILDNNANSLVVLNDLYEPSADNSRCGTIRYQLSNLSNGRHTLTLKAWNIYNYSGSATIQFDVANGEEETVSNYTAYPNPTTEAVTLRAEHNKSVTAATIEIYNTYGKKIRTLHPSISPEGYVIGPIRWDFSNDAGVQQGKGIYISRLTVTTNSGEQQTFATKIIKIQ